MGAARPSGALNLVGGSHAAPTAWKRQHPKLPPPQQAGLGRVASSTCGARVPSGPLPPHLPATPPLGPVRVGLDLLSFQHTGGPAGAAGMEEPSRVSTQLGCPRQNHHPPLGNDSPGNTSLLPCLNSHLVPRPGPLPAGLTFPPAQCQGHGLPGAPRLARGSPGPIRAQRGGQQG